MKDISREKRNEFIKELLDKKKVTPEQIIDIFGLTRQTLWNILNPVDKSKLDKRKK
jgi:DNA invertase Pin-like site-specific DNA recombinase